MWEQFIAIDENKADLAYIMSEALIPRAHQLSQHLELVTSGGFKVILKSTSGREVPHLSSNHEEADTRLVLHALDAKDAGHQHKVVKCRETDVFLLLLHFWVDLILKFGWYREQQRRGNVSQLKLLPRNYQRL